MLDELDAVSAAPAHHRVLLENEQVRVLETVVRPGEQTELHTHVWPAHLYVLSWSDFERLGPGGEVIFRSSDLGVAPGPGTALWSGPLPLHAFRNVGRQNFHVITTEVKS